MTEVTVRAIVSFLRLVLIWEGLREPSDVLRIFHILILMVVTLVCYVRKLTVLLI